MLGRVATLRGSSTVRNGCCRKGLSITCRCCKHWSRQGGGRNVRWSASDRQRWGGRCQNWRSMGLCWIEGGGSAHDLGLAQVHRGRRGKSLRECSSHGRGAGETCCRVFGEAT